MKHSLCMPFGLDIVAIAYIFAAPGYALPPNHHGPVERPEAVYCTIKHLNTSSSLGSEVRTTTLGDNRSDHDHGLISTVSETSGIVYATWSGSSHIQDHGYAAHDVLSIRGDLSTSPVASGTTFASQTANLSIASTSEVASPKRTLGGSITVTEAGPGAPYSASRRITSSTAAGVNASAAIIPGLVTSVCEYHGPCAAVCNNNDTICLQAASSVSSTCEASWTKYWDLRDGTQIPGPGWTAVTSVSSEAAQTSTATIDRWTSFSSANFSLIVGDPTAYPKETTMTPVYALGSPIPSISVTTYPAMQQTITYYTKPPPTCKFNQVMQERDCGQCTMTGGTVQLFYWPPGATQVHTTRRTGSSKGLLPLSTILDGTTLYSPTVYISLETVHAQNSCSQVGKTHAGTMIAMKPEDVSTQVHFGGQVLQSGANHYGRLVYADLTGLPPASVYEQQETCEMFGCPTIYPSTWDPTLVVPTELRTIDPAWQSCAVDLEGL